jgi:hypothetical protein
LQGGRNANFAFYGPAPDTSVTAMLKTHLRFLPLTKTAQAAASLPSAPNLPAAVRQLQQRLATQAAADPVIAQELEWIADCQLRVGFAQFKLAQAAWELDTEARFLYFGEIGPVGSSNFTPMLAFVLHNFGRRS